MNYTICLDPYSLNFTPSELSGNGFAIYTDADNFTSPIAVNIPASSIFSPPLGNCSITLTNIPNNANQILVVDQCDGLPPSTPGAPDAPSYTCCYALINLPEGCVPWCEECSITFDTFQTSSIGKLVAGNLQSSCGTVTDYVIGWYLDGDYSAPALTTGFGSAAGPYQFGPHPLTGSGAVPVVGGSWEGIIHDIIINGTLYSNVASGSKGGTPIPFESCFDTIVVDPLTCNNGPYSATSKYSHQFYFDSQAVGTTPAPVSLNYELSPSTKYFAYAFKGYSIWDKLEVKWISGDPNATSNPNLYSQPIYLENLKIGQDTPWDPLGQTSAALAYNIGNAVKSNTTISNFNNKWPKDYPSWQTGYFQRVLTLTNLETSSNPLFPDSIEITVTPNPANNNTKWDAGFQCLDEFDCVNCITDNWPNGLPTINRITLFKQYPCPSQQILTNHTGCFNPLPNGSSPYYSDILGKDINSISNGLNNLNINLTNTRVDSSVSTIANNLISLGGQSSCSTFNWNGTTSNPWTNPSNLGPIYIQLICSSPSTSTITLNKTPNQIKLTFNSEDDYLHYKDNIINTASPVIPSGTSTSILCTPQNNTLIGTLPYYQVFGIFLPSQPSNVDCGDNSTKLQYFFHINDYLNIQYVENPSSNLWSITIPQTPMTNCFPSSTCTTCTSTVSSFVFGYNTHVQNNSIFSFTTNVGAKFQNPIKYFSVTRNVTGGVSGSICATGTQAGSLYIPWYSVNTIPFISSSNGWVNLPSLGGTIPCDFSAYIRNESAYKSTYNYLQFVFPNLTGSFDYSLSTNDFRIYSLAGLNVTPSGSILSTSVCPTGSLIYSYIGGVATMHSSSYFYQGNPPTLIIL
jgi:hypothetical protein